MITTPFDGVNAPSLLEIKVAFLLVFLSFITIPQTAFADTWTYNDGFHMGVVQSTLAVPTGTTFTFGNAYAMGEITDITGDVITATPVNSGFTPGSTDVQAFLAGASAVPGNYIIISTGGSEGYCFFIWDGSTADVTSCAVPPGVLGTTILSVDPPDGSTIATSSLPYEFVTIGNIAAADWKEGIRLRIKVDRNTDQQAVGALTAFDSAAGNYTYFDIPVESGVFVLSTTTLDTLLPIDRLGTYRMVQDIQVPGLGVHWWIFNFDFSYETLTSTSTSFTIGTTTQIDNITQVATDYLNGIASSTSQGDPLADCKFSWFESAIDFSIGSKLLNCMGGIAVWAIVPAPGVISTSFSRLRDGMLTRAPWGYATRLVTVFTSAAAATTTATSTLPTWTAPIYLTGTSTPDTTLTFDPGDMLDGGAALLNSIKANGTTKNMKDIVEPMILLFLAISVLVIIFHDVMHMGHHTKS